MCKNQFGVDVRFGGPIPWHFIMSGTYAFVQHPKVSPTQMTTLALISTADNETLRFFSGHQVRMGHWPQRGEKGAQKTQERTEHQIIRLCTPQTATRSGLIH